MIINFKHKGLEQLFIKDSKKLLDSRDVPKITRILDRLDSAVEINDMSLPGWDLHELQGKRKGVWTIAVRKNWKITFTFRNGDVCDVNLEDYH